MKYLVFLLLIFSSQVNGQGVRDSLNNDFLTFEDMETIIDGNNMYVITTYHSRDGRHYIERDTIDKLTLGAYCDERIAEIRPDSVDNYNEALMYFYYYNKKTTAWINAKNRLLKLYAIKPN